MGEYLKRDTFSSVLLGNPSEQGKKNNPHLVGYIVVLA